MFSRIVNHLTESRIYLRPNRPFAEGKFQNQYVSLRSTLFPNFDFDFSADFSKNGFSHINSHPEFATKAPFHFQFGTNHAASISGRIPVNLKFLPIYLQGNTIQLALNAKFPSLEHLSAIFSFEHERNDHFLQIAYSTVPSMISFSQHFKKFGYEYLNSFDDEQISAAAYFNNEYGRTELSILGSMYGPLTGITLTDFDSFRISSMLQLNFLTFDSRTAFGFIVPFKDSFAHLSFHFPEKKIQFEISLNHFKDDKKIGASFFMPFQMEPIIDLFQRHK